MGSPIISNRAASPFSRTHESEFAISRSEGTGPRADSLRTGAVKTLNPLVLDVGGPRASDRMDRCVGPTPQGPPSIPGGRRKGSLFTHLFTHRSQLSGRGGTSQHYPDAGWDDEFAGQNRIGWSGAVFRNAVPSAF